MMETLGVALQAIDPGVVVLAFGHDDRLTQQHGLIHAGMLGTVLDSACGWAALSLMPADHAVLTVEYKLNLLRRQRKAVPWHWSCDQARSHTHRCRRRSGRKQRCRSANRHHDGDVDGSRRTWDQRLSHRLLDIRRSRAVCRPGIGNSVGTSRAWGSQD